MRVRAVVLSFLVVCAAPVFALTRSWTGAVNANWSEGGNWSPAGAPAPEDKLIFPVGPALTVMNNDLPAWTSFGTMDFRAGYTLNGNPLTLTGDLMFDHANSPAFHWNVDTRLGASVRFHAAITSSFTGAIDVNGHTLTVDAYNTVFYGPIDGSGAIVVTGSGISIRSSGAFSGTFNGVVDIIGSMPNASITGQLSGTGTFGSASVSALYPGGKAPCCADSHTVGTLETGSISIGGPMSVDLVPGGTSDLLRVNGTVTLGNWLNVSAATGVPAAGESFTIIDNDAADAINSTFAGLAEGATINVNGATLAISYHGGDGNDVVLTTAAVKKSWTGAVSALWSEPGNWSPAAIPAANEPLVFPGGAARTTMTNDLPAYTSFGAMDFRADYTLNGNPLTLTGDITFVQMNQPGFHWNVDTRLGASVRFHAAITSLYTGTIDVNGYTLTIDPYNTVFMGPIDGSGTIVVSQSGGMSIRSSGAFSGTLNGVIDIIGSMPAASFNGPFSGTGTVGNVSTTALYPGGKAPCCADPHAAGTLETKSISIDGPMYVDLVPGGSSDLLRVNGTVTVDGSLHVSVTTGAPGAGESYTIIENDGTDAIDGTFTGLAEGAKITINGATLTITYVGGDGNDVVLFTAKATKSWTGAVSELWSEPGNWSPAAIPTAGEPLIFPSGVTRTTMTNDLPAWTTVGAMEFRGMYTVNGNPLTLSGDLVFDHATHPLFTCNVDLKLAEAVTLGGALTNTYNGSIDVNGEALTIHSYNTRFLGAIIGGGKITVQGSGVTLLGDGTFEGKILGTIDVQASLPDANVEGLDGHGLSGNGTVGKVSLGENAPLYLGGKPPCCADQHTIGTLSTKSIDLDRSALFADITPGQADRLAVTGKVTLDEARLYLTVPSGSPAAGQEFTIIDNDGNDAIDGVFQGQPENSIIAAGPWKFRVHYAAGDGNDVVLTAIDDTVTESSQNAASTQFGEGATFTARVTSRSGATPAGTVTFTDNGTPIGTAPLTAGVASFAAAALDPGDHTIGAQFEGTAIYAPSASTLSHKVFRGKTTTQLSAPGSIVFGTDASVSVDVQPVAPATGSPSGSVTSTVGSATLNDGQASIALSSLDAGTHTFGVAYAGDTRFEGSDSTNATLTVTKAPTVIEATSAQDMLSIRVSAPHRPSLAVAGTVAVSEGGVLLAEQALAAGSVSIALPQLATGEHHLVVRYTGTGNYEASSTEIVHAVDAPQLSVRDVVVAEGDTGEQNVTVRVELSWPTPHTVTVGYATADGAAKDGEDYRGARGTLTFAPYELVKSIDLPVYSDTKAEPDERLELTLSTPENATLGRARATVLISNDDLSYRALLGLTYANGLTLDLYTPVDGSGPFPLIVWVPGSTTYDPEHAFAPALRQTARGYAVATVRYRSPAAARFPAQLEDLQSAVDWLRANAAQYGLDPQRIAAWGASAGGHLAALLGVTSADLQAVIVWGGASDLARLQEDAASASCTTKFNERTSPQSSLIGCALNTCPQKAAAASPVTFATADDPSFLIMHGTADCVVPAMQGTRLHDALAAAGAEATLKVIDGGAPATWTSPVATDAVDAFLDRELKSTTKRRSMRR